VKVRQEIEDKIEKKGLNVNISNFHAMGNSIIGKVEGGKHALSELSKRGDRTALPKWVENRFKEKVRLRQESKPDDFLNDSEPVLNQSTEDSFSEKLTNFVAYNYHPYKSEFEFKSLGDYYKYLKEYEIRSLQGKPLRSYGEVEIANFLFLNGIKYEYESTYPYYKPNELHGPYQPDFYLPDYNIYIEHFGIDRQNRTAPFVPNKEYLDDMDWKRKLHRINNTKLIETYNYQKSEGTLLELLEKQLKDYNVEFNPIPQEEIFVKINEAGLVNLLALLISKFLNLYKSGNYNYEEIVEEAQKRPDSIRCRSFLDLFKPIYDDYEKNLESQKKIDFHDMINKATKYINEGKYPRKYKYILVDEFQDISLSIYRFIQALLRNGDAKSFCVGDDWQAIYRFNGGEVSVMTDFDNHFEPSEYLYLNKTFRFNSKLCDISSQFIMKNKAQLPKNLNSEPTDKPAVSIKWSRKSDLQSSIEECLEEIQFNEIKPKSESPQVKIFLLGRYGKQLQFHTHRKEILDMVSELNEKFPDLHIEFNTAHKAKGTEAAYVIVFNLVAGKYGFPCLIEDDPVLNLVLTKKDPFPNAEERRLFYVAITRAKKHVYLITDDTRPSTFIDELVNDKYDIRIQGYEKHKPNNCPICSTGQVVRIDGEYQPFYACNNWPYCKYRADNCPSCGQKSLIENGDKFKCLNDLCGFTTSKCPKCGGYLILHKGSPDFWGCSNYSTMNCTYKEKAGNNAHAK